MTVAGTNGGCCVDVCCADGQTCCNGVCGTKGACCKFDTGSCSEETSLCCAQQGGTYQGEGTTCTPADLCRPECENCHTISAVVYECSHPWDDGTITCGTAACIVNTINTATCDSFPYRLGQPNCNTKTLPNDPWVVQEVRGLLDSSCANYWPGDFHDWMRQFYGCGTECFEDTPIRIRCDTFGCEGTLLYTRSRYPRRACGCP